jgi:hypothetical protein
MVAGARFDQMVAAQLPAGSCLPTSAIELADHNFQKAAPAAIQTYANSLSMK